MDSQRSINQACQSRQFLFSQFLGSLTRVQVRQGLLYCISILSFQITAVQAPVLSGLKYLTSAAGTPALGQVGLDIPERKLDAKADRHALVIFQINSQREHRWPP